MKLRILFRVIQEVPVENRELQKKYEHQSDLCALRLGMPLPERMRPFTGLQTNLIRVHEREFESIANFCKLMQKWYDDPECQELDANWEKCYNWENVKFYTQMMQEIPLLHGFRWQQNREKQSNMW